MSLPYIHVQLNNKYGFHSFTYKMRICLLRQRSICSYFLSVYLDYLFKAESAHLFCYVENSVPKIGRI